MEARLPNKIRFDAWTLDTQSGDLTKGEVTTRLQIQPLQILLALLENPGNLVSREQLIARLWPKGIVEFDTSLNTAVRKLRIALSDDSDHPRFIDTIPRRGYRFIAKIETRRRWRRQNRATRPPRRQRSDADTSRCRGGTGARSRSRPDSSTGATSRVENPSIVILPFVDMSAEQKDAALCLGIPDEIGNRLAQISNVRVVSRTSAVKYQGKSADVREIGKVARSDVCRGGFGSPGQE